MAPRGLVDRSRRPQACSDQTPASVVEALLECRRRHPTWGAKKLLSILSRSHPDWEWPARSTCSDLIKRHGLVTGRRRRQYPGHPGRPMTPMDEPNAIWTADFKGQFRTRDGEYCYPLTVVDGYSRYLLGCQGLRSTAIDLARPVFQRLFTGTAADHPDGQRGTLRDDSPGAPVDAVGVVDPAGDRSRADRTGAP